MFASFPRSCSPCQRGSFPFLDACHVTERCIFVFHWTRCGKPGLRSFAGFGLGPAGENVEQHPDSGGRAAAEHWARRNGRLPVFPSSCPQLLSPDVVCAQMPCFQCGQMNTATTILNDFGQPVFQCRCVRLAGKIDMLRVSRSIRAVLARVCVCDA